MRRLAGTLLAGLLAGLAAAAAGAADVRHDGEQPIEINADSLEVRQDDRIAVFRGNVDAVQGQVRLRADELKVHYRAGAGGQRGGVDGTIERIDATGNVFVSSPGETAQGDSGVYDVARREITLTGKVVLTRGQNVIRGRRLVLNMTTGQSRIDGGGAQGRVRGLFVPPKKSGQ